MDTDENVTFSARAPGLRRLSLSLLKGRSPGQRRRTGTPDIGATLSPNVALDERPLQWHSTWATGRIYATQWLFYQHYRTILSGNVFSPCRTSIPQDTMIQRESRLLNDSEGHGMPLAIFYVESEKQSACDGNIIGRHADPCRLGQGTIIIREGIDPVVVLRMS